jgi:nitroreductase
MTALLTRISPLRLTGDDIEESCIGKMLAAAVRAPDHGRLRPWRFIVVRGDARARLGEVMAQALRLRNPAATDAALRAEHEKPLRAPLIVVVAAMIRSDTRIPAVEQVASAAAAAQNILLAAHALGLGAFWRTGPAAYDPHVKRALGLEAEDEIIGLLYIGRVETPGPAKSPDLQGVVEEWTQSARQRP